MGNPSPERIPNYPSPGMAGKGMVIVETLAVNWVTTLAVDSPLPADGNSNALRRCRALSCSPANSKPPGHDGTLRDS